MHLRDQHDYDPVWATKRRVKQAYPEQVDVAIVGAGLGGLTAGAYLAQAGYRVALFDQHYVAGGCCTQFSRGGPKNRYNFDIGLHYIGDCGPQGKIPRLLAGVGIELQYQEMDRNGFDTLVFPDFEFPIPVGHDAYRARLLEMFPSERRGIDRYLRFLREVDGFQRQMEAAGGRPGFGLAWWAMTQGRMAGRFKGSTLEGLLDHCTDNEQLRAVMAGQNGDYGLPPSQVSAALHAGLSNHYFHGAYYPRGGGQIIADRLSETVEAAGGSVHLRSRVRKMLAEGGAVHGLLVEDQKGNSHEVRAGIVLSNADLRETFDELLDADQQPEGWRQQVGGMRMAAAIYMTCLGVRGSMADYGMRNSNYWAFDSYNFEHFYESLNDLKPRGCYITSATMKDPSTRHHAPEGVASLEIMTVLSGRARDWEIEAGDIESWKYRRNQHYQELKAGIEDDLVARAESLFPGVAANITFRESATPISHSRYTLATDGTGYGLACTPDQFFEHRPNYMTPIRNLYLAGASTRSGHGVLGAMESGYKSARRIARALGQEMEPMPAQA